VRTALQYAAFLKSAGTGSAANAAGTASALVGRARRLSGSTVAAETATCSLSHRQVLWLRATYPLYASGLGRTDQRYRSTRAHAGLRADLLPQELRDPEKRSRIFEGRSSPALTRAWIAENCSRRFDRVGIGPSRSLSCRACSRASVSVRSRSASRLGSSASCFQGSHANRTIAAAEKIASTDAISQGSRAVVRPENEDSHQRGRISDWAESPGAPPEKCRAAPLPVLV
jgi:hypothetical protein